MNDSLDAGGGAPSRNSQRWKLALLGAVAAVAGGILCWLTIALVSGVDVRSAVSLAFHTVPLFLGLQLAVVGGLIATAVSLWEPRRGIAMLFATLLTPAVVGFGGPSQWLWRDLRWERQILRPLVVLGTSEAEIVRRFGWPTSVELAPDFKFIGGTSGCEVREGSRRLVYFPKGGGIYRVFHLDADRQLYCESMGSLYY